MAYARKEAFLGVSCIAAPIRNFWKDIIAAISVFVPTIRMTKEKRKEYSKILLETPEGISKEF